MTFEFIISYLNSPETNIVAVLRDVLKDVLEDNGYEFEDEVVEGMIVPRNQRSGESVEENGNASRHMLLGFTLELPEEIDRAQVVIDEFASILPDTQPVLHVVKFEDPLLQQELARRVEEIFVLEMKLRRVLSLIYLHAYQNGDPYDLLHEETVHLMTKTKAEQMKAMAENQFFHLTFNQYINLNQRSETKVPALLEIVRSAEQYDTFRAEILRLPVEHKDDIALLAGLKERMDAIEAMRNCVAHNRRPSSRATENYVNAWPILHQLLDQYLERWAWSDSAAEVMEG